jgi:hypothetical protein
MLDGRSMTTSMIGWLAFDARTVRQVWRELESGEEGVVDGKGVGALLAPKPGRKRYPRGATAR